jgi:hypothetical protein
MTNRLHLLGVAQYSAAAIRKRMRVIHELHIEGINRSLSTPGTILYGWVGPIHAHRACDRQSTIIVATYIYTEPYPLWHYSIDLVRAALPPAHCVDRSLIFGECCTVVTAPIEHTKHADEANFTERVRD